MILTFDTYAEINERLPKIKITISSIQSLNDYAHTKSKWQFKDSFERETRFK